MSAVEGVRVRRVRTWLVAAATVALLGLNIAPSAAASRPEIAVLVPIVATESASEFVPVDELSAAAGPGGAWWELSRAAITHGATIALDSRIVASIAALGDDAPATVTSWLSTVTRARPLYLAWGNADPFVLSSIGPSYQVSAIALGEIAGIPTADIVAWPTGRAGSDRNVARVSRLGYSSFIVENSAFPEARGALSSKLSDLVEDAVSPGSTADLAEVANAIRESLVSGTPLSLPRNPHDIDARRGAVLLDELYNDAGPSRRVIPTGVDELGAVSVSDVPRSAIRALMAQHRTDRRVAGIASDPRVISDPRLRRTCVLAGLVDRDNFAGLVRAYVRGAKSYDEFVSFSIGADFTVLANSTELPLTVTNSTTSDISAVATLNAVSAIVNIEKPNQTVTIPAGSSVQITFPMTSVTNGSTALRATLTTSDGIPLSEPELIEIDVQAQWEGLTLIGFIAVVSTILSIGIARTVRDRRARP